MVNPNVDPQFGFMTLDWDGKIRMDCSSPYAMASLVASRDRFAISTGNDADADRHGIVTADGLMNPNHFLAVAIGYLFANRPDWPLDAGVGKTAVSSSMIDYVAAELGRKLVETPVGFKWFVPGLLDGSLGFGGEESAGASFLRRDGSVWTTDKDGIILALLASEILAVTGETPSQRYAALTDRFGAPIYARTDVATTAEAKAKLAKLSAADVTATELAGDPITARLTEAPGNGAPLGGLKVVTDGGWFAARPSGTEDVYKVYAESFRGPEHLAQIQEQAREVVSAALGLSAGLRTITCRGWFGCPARPGAGGRAAVRSPVVLSFGGWVAPAIHSLRRPDGRAHHGTRPWFVTSFATPAKVVKNESSLARAPRSEGVRCLMLAPQRNDSAPDLQIRTSRHGQHI